MRENNSRSQTQLRNEETNINVVSKEKTNSDGTFEQQNGQLIQRVEFSPCEEPTQGWASLFSASHNKKKILKSMIEFNTTTLQTTTTRSLLSKEIQEENSRAIERINAEEFYESVDILFVHDSTFVTINLKKNETIYQMVLKALEEKIQKSGVDAYKENKKVSSNDKSTLTADNLDFEVRFMDGDAADMDLPPIKNTCIVGDIDETEFAIFLRPRVSDRMFMTPSSRKRSVLIPDCILLGKGIVERGIVFLQIVMHESLVDSARRASSFNINNEDNWNEDFNASSKWFTNESDGSIANETMISSFLACGRDDTLSDCVRLLCKQRKFDFNECFAFRRLESGPYLEMNSTVDALNENYKVQLVYKPRRVSFRRIGRESIALLVNMDEFNASQYTEYNVVKINRHGSRQQRILGVDRDKMYNLPQQNCLNFHDASGLNGYESTKAFLKAGGSRFVKSVLNRKGVVTAIKKSSKNICDINSIGYADDTRRTLNVVFTGKSDGFLHAYVYEFETTAECANLLSRLTFLINIHEMK